MLDSIEVSKLEAYLRKEIPEADQWQDLMLITEGWSHDLKFKITTQAGETQLLRLAKATALSEEKEKYASFKALASKQLPIPKLLRAGLCCNGKYTYRIFSWLNGKPLRDAIKDLSGQQQIQLGQQAGQILQQIHQTQAPENFPDWEDFYNEKINRKIACFKNGGFVFSKANKMIDFIENNRFLLKQRPSTFQHGDFHIGNMLLTPENKLAIIDFDRLDFGDPWEEFNRIIWTASESKAFAISQINAYFEAKVPEAFFPLLALYSATGQIGAFAWAAGYGPGEVKTHKAQTLKILEWYDDFRQTVPRWFD